MFGFRISPLLLDSKSFTVTLPPNILTASDASALFNTFKAAPAVVPLFNCAETSFLTLDKSSRVPLKPCVKSVVITPSAA